MQSVVFVCSFVCLFVFYQDKSQTSAQVLMKCSQLISYRMWYSWWTFEQHLITTSGKTVGSSKDFPVSRMSEKICSWIGFEWWTFLGNLHVVEILLMYYVTYLLVRYVLMQYLLFIVCHCLRHIFNWYLYINIDVVLTASPADCVFIVIQFAAVRPDQ